jgi:hypothetical protein
VAKGFKEEEWKIKNGRWKMKPKTSAIQVEKRVWKIAETD